MFEFFDLIVGLFVCKGCFVGGVFEHLQVILYISSVVKLKNVRVFNLVASYVRVGVC